MWPPGSERVSGADLSLPGWRSLDETRDEASVPSLLGGEIPAAIGATSYFFRIHVCAVDQLGKPLFLETQPVVDVGDHFFQHPPATAQWALEVQILDHPAAVDEQRRVAGQPPLVLRKRRPHRPACRSDAGLPETPD